jgi:DNA-binding CsgD family transcriptional regulator
VVFLNDCTAKVTLSAFISLSGLRSIIGGAIATTTLFDLTQRELEILQLVLEGHTNKTIAAEIFIREEADEFHLDNLYTQLGVRTRLMAGLGAMQQGLEVETREIPSYIKLADPL